MEFEEKKFKLLTLKKPCEKKFSFTLFLLICLSTIAFSQSVVVTPKEFIYKRPKPIQDFKKSFVVMRPQIKARTPALSRKIEQTVSYEKNNGFNLKEEISENQWLEEANYKVIYNKNGLLDILLITEGSAAYSSFVDKEVVVNIKTGNGINAPSVFTSLKGLALKVSQAQKAEIRKAIIQNKRDYNDDFSDLFNEVKFTVENLDEFSLSDKGITFLYDYDLPHVDIAFQPASRYFFAWTKLKPFIRRDGLLGKFIR